MHQNYKPFRNYLRQFPLVGSLEAIWAYHEHIVSGLQLPDHMQFRDRLGQPTTEAFTIYLWELDILSREIVLNGDLGGKRSIANWAGLSEVINRLRRLGDEISAEYGRPDNILRDLNRIVHHQFPWQRRPSNRTMVRAFKLFGTDAMRRILEQTTGVGVEEFFRLGVAVTGHFLKHPGLNTTQDYTSLGISPEVSRRFFERLMIDTAALRKKTKAAQRYDDSWEYAVNPLRDHPLVQFDRTYPERVLCPVPTFLLRRFSDGLFYDMVGHRDFPNAMGDGFEAYVGEVIREVLRDGFQVRGEEEYRIGKNRKDGVDWIVSDSTGHIFIECKTRRLRQDAKFIVDGVGLEAAMDAMAGFVVQHYRNIRDALDGKTSWKPDGLPIFPVVVTLEDWWIFTPPVVEMLDNRLKARMQEAELPLAMLDEMPAVVASADEFETAVLIMSKTGISKYLGAKQSPEHRTWALSAFSPGEFPDELRATRRELFDDEWREVIMPEALVRAHRAERSS